MDMKLAYLFLLSILGGILLGFSFPFTGGFFLQAFLAMVPLFLANYQINKAVKGKFLLRFSVNYLYFICYNLVTTWWIYNASEGGMYMAVFANALLMCLPFMFAGFLEKHLGENKSIFGLLVLWLAFEYLHFYWELSWPWLNLGHVLGDSPKLMQWFEYSGVTGGSLWVMLINIFIYFIIRNVKFKAETFKIQTPNILFISLAIVIPISSSLFMYYAYKEKSDPVNITIAQPNIESNNAKFTLPASIQLNKMLMGIEDKISEDTDLILAPETAMPYPIKEDQLKYHPDFLLLKNFLDMHHQVPLLIGADTYEIFEEKISPACSPYGGQFIENYNTAVLIQSNIPLETYHKAKLVLGGEKIPFIANLPWLQKYSIELGGTSGMLGVGQEPKLFEAKGVFYAPLICYESVYGDYVAMFVRKGATVLTVITNDGWWGDTPGYHQHRMFSQIRAIENRRAVARSANTGISCFIDQRGDIINEMGWNEYGGIQAVVNQNIEITTFTKYGDIIGRICCYLTLAMLLYGFVEKMKKTGFWAKIQAKPRR
jgi:apolipoprotein N-acyltransferase